MGEQDGAVDGDGFRFAVGADVDLPVAAVRLAGFEDLACCFASVAEGAVGGSDPAVGAGFVAGGVWDRFPLFGRLRH